VNIALTIPNGKLKYLINYDLSTLIEYDSLGNKVQEDLDYKKELCSNKIGNNLVLLLKDTELLKVE